MDVLMLREKKTLGSMSGRRNCFPAMASVLEMFQVIVIFGQGRVLLLVFGSLILVALPLDK